MLPSACHFRLAYIVDRDLGNIYYTHAHLAKDRYNYSIYIAHHAKPLDAHSHTLYDACIIMFRAACCCKDPGPYNHIRMHGEQGSPFSHDIRDPLMNFRDSLFCSMYEHGWKI